MKYIIALASVVLLLVGAYFEIRDNGWFTPLMWVIYSMVLGLILTLVTPVSTVNVVTRRSDRL